MPIVPNELYQTALHTWDVGESREAAHLLEQLLQSYPNWEHSAAAYALSCIYDDLGELDNALFWNLKALDCDSGHIIFITGYMSLLYDAHKFDEALNFASECITKLRVDGYKKDVKEFADEIRAQKTDLCHHSEKP